LRLIVLYDDIDLPVGDIRIRASGSAGTHNGMRSILASLGGNRASRAYVSAWASSSLGANLASHVLGKPAREERALLEGACAQAAAAAVLIVEGKLGEAQARFNKKKKKEEIVIRNE
jgi:PTH1 family peptidyl-tRNA hydrolase